jgi:CTP:molybdopterin cytidylyltransferase MocA
MIACGIVLAAGAGTRFGGPKQLALLDSRPLLQWAVDAACAAEVLDRVLVVLGAHADAIEAAVPAGRAELRRCEDWREGLAASLRCGFDAAAGADWIIITLGDEPRLPPAAIEHVVAVASAASAEVLAVRATWQGHPGHPVALNARLAPAVAELRGDRGARDLIASVPALEVECGELGDPGDVDTPEQLAALRAAPRGS